MIENNSYETNWNNNWDVKIPIIGITKNQIRNIIQDVYSNGIFGTLGADSIKIKDNNIILKIELSNASPSDIQIGLAEKVIKEINSLSLTPMKFSNYKVKIEEVDLHGYEPRYISVGTMIEIEEFYLIIKNQK